MTSQHNLTSQHKNLTSQHNYLTSDGRSMAEVCHQTVKFTWNLQYIWLISYYQHNIHFVTCNRYRRGSTNFQRGMRFRTQKEVKTPCLYTLWKYINLKLKQICLWYNCFSPFFSLFFSAVFFCFIAFFPFQFKGGGVAISITLSRSASAFYIAPSVF